MTRIKFENLPSANTPINAENLNKLNNVIISSEEPTTGEEVWLEKGKNLIDENLLIFGMELDGKGGTIARSNYYITPFIEIESNTTYTFKGAKSLKGIDNYYTDYYDKDYNFISSNEFSTFTTPSNAKYVRFNGCSDFSIDLQLEKGEKIAPKKIHTKNDNGVYEEFYEENTKITIFSGSKIKGGESIILNNAKRFLDVYFVMSSPSGNLGGKYTIDTNLNDAFGSVILLAHDSENSLEYYVSESLYNKSTNNFKHNRTGYFNINTGTFTSRNGNSAYYIYKIDTYD
jgi:hypothetical protein